MNKVEQKKKNKIQNKFASSFLNEEVEFSIEQVILDRQVRTVRNAIKSFFKFLLRII